MRISKEEMEKTFREMEKKYELRNNMLSEIYLAEKNVVFLGRRRNILKQIRSIITRQKHQTKLDGE